MTAAVIATLKANTAAIDERSVTRSRVANIHHRINSPADHPRRDHQTKKENVVPMAR